MNVQDDLARINNQYNYRLYVQEKRKAMEFERRYMETIRLDDAEWQEFSDWYAERYCGSRPHRPSIEWWLKWKEGKTAT